MFLIFFSRLEIEVQSSHISFTVSTDGRTWSQSTILITDHDKCCSGKLYFRYLYSKQRKSSNTFRYMSEFFNNNLLVLLWENLEVKGIPFEITGAKIVILSSMFTHLWDTGQITWSLSCLSVHAWKIEIL